eukprot:NODE_1833_length_748_cov_219.010014_g1515_i1.p3 GENE.NODE_1833_length_748_cov_219.010014_g1515_i1~~NODE_1833_length_748_cov_219.010014_g1515_i1.p3  ORF type:complete len:107 (-),score=18.62 NODE_1833_length_748_cov_219.010014_g1515_i1:234-554(-)
MRELRAPPSQCEDDAGLPAFLSTNLQGRAYESQYEQEIINYFRQKEVAKKRSSISPVASKPMDDLLKRRKMLVALRSPPAPPNDPPTSPPGDAIGMFTMELDAAAA